MYHNLVFLQATDSGIATSGDPSPVLEAEREKRLPEPQVRLEMFSHCTKNKVLPCQNQSPTDCILLSIAEERAEEGGGGRWCEGEQVVQPVGRGGPGGAAVGEEARPGRQRQDARAARRLAPRRRRQAQARNRQDQGWLLFSTRRLQRCTVTKTFHHDLYPPLLSNLDIFITKRRSFLSCRKPSM